MVRHAPGSIEIELAWRAGLPYLIVRDRGPSFALADATLPDDPLAEGGRGLFLIARYAGAATVVPRFGGGNEVTVALVLAPGAPLVQTLVPNQSLDEPFQAVALAEMPSSVPPCPSDRKE